MMALAGCAVLAAIIVIVLLFAWVELRARQLAAYHDERSGGRP